MNDDKFIEISDYEGVSPDYLMHYQLKGAKWGVRRGPPYPLGSGLKTDVKKVTKAAEKRAKANGEKVPKVEKKKTSSKTSSKKASDNKKKAKPRPSKEKLQKMSPEDRLKNMTNEELRKQIERMKLENEYRNLLPKEKKGESFLSKSAKTLRELNAVGTEVSSAIKTGKQIANMFGIGDSKRNRDAEFNWESRLPGESAKAYSDRLNALANIKRKKAEFGKDEEAASKKDREAAEAKRKEKEAAAARKKAQDEANAKEKAEAEAAKRQREEEEKERKRREKAARDFAEAVKRAQSYSPDPNQLRLPGTTSSSYWDAYGRGWI